MEISPVILLANLPDHTFQSQKSVTYHLKVNVCTLYLEEDPHIRAIQNSLGIGKLLPARKCPWFDENLLV